jgi:hypothetical protein
VAYNIFQTPGRFLVACIICVAMLPSGRASNSPHNQELTKYIYCAVDLDMYKRWVSIVVKEGREELFADSEDYNEESIEFLETSSDFFAKKAIALSNSDHVAEVAHQRYQYTTSMLKSKNQEDFDQIWQSWNQCLEVLIAELQSETRRQ